jgi:4-amino-4-deoxy-L-arabinose transferase-like glycosyltransferase
VHTTGAVRPDLALLRHRGETAWRNASPTDRIVLGVAVLLLVCRFVALEHSPPGFWLDEYLGALHLICLAQTGVSGTGDHWPLFTFGWGGGFYTPAYLYPGIVWTKLFGTSIAAFRAFPAFFTLLTILGIHALARRMVGPRFAFWAFVLACLSPWSFQFSRVAWDPPLAPAFLVWACYFWYGRRPIVDGLASGLLFAIAIYTYPPTRIQTPLLVGVLLVLGLRARTLRLGRVVALLATVGVLLVPLARYTLTSHFTGRSMRLAIFAPEYLREHRGIWTSSAFFVRTLVDNLALHFRPSFLFLTGDPNLRHSTQLFGELGLLDDLALLFGILLVGAALRGRAAHVVQELDAAAVRGYFALCAAGIVFGVLPAALTWEGLPHALRGIGTWPFVSLFGGGLLALAEKQWRATGLVACATSAVHAALFLFLYFRVYPGLAREAFNVPIYEALTDVPHLSDRDKSALAHSEPYAVRYYLMRSGHYDCRSSEQTLRAWMQPSLGR